MGQGNGSEAGNAVSPLMTAVSPLMTADELAMWLHCTRRAVYDRVYRGQLPGSVRVGRRLYFMRENVLMWLRDGSERRSWRNS